MSDQLIVEPRQCVLGGEAKKRGLFGRFGWKGFGMGVVALLAYAYFQTTFKSWWPLAVLLALIATVGIGSMARTSSGDSWASVRRDVIRRRIARRTGADQFMPGVHPDTGIALVPREVGVIQAFTVPNGPHRIAVLAHASGSPYWSCVVEVVGGGDGLVEVAATNARGKDFGDLLFACSRANFPVDELDVTTRVTVGGREDYLEWLRERAGAAGPQLEASAVEVAESVTRGAEKYRSWMVVCMPDEQLAAQVERSGLRPTLEAKAEHAARTTLEVCRLARRRGLKPVKILTPEELGGLIRHLYAPSIDADDHADLDGVRAGWVPYRSETEMGFEAASPLDRKVWWHATASVPRDGWPLRAVDTRFLESLVTQVSPATIRTVTAQHRLVPKVAARKEAVRAQTLDEADMLAEAKKGKISSGESEAQAASAARVLEDLLYEQAAGCRPALRVTVSAESAAELAAARERMDSHAQDAGFNRLLWHEGRHHQAHLLTLPLGRGIARTAPSQWSHLGRLPGLVSRSKKGAS